MSIRDAAETSSHVFGGRDRRPDVCSTLTALDGLLRDGVPRFPHLRELGLLLNDIEDISPLSYFTSLESLNVRHQQGNKISDYSPVAALTNLTCLNLQYNELDVDDDCCEPALVCAHNPGVKVSHDPCSSPPVGDFDFDCWVGAGDFALPASAWMTDLGSDGWNEAYDISIPRDSRIDMDDLQGLAQHWLQCPGQCD